MTYGDHPRGCGEHRYIARHLSTSDGSSPRMRGALCSGLLKPGLSGIIPADAGSTAWRCTGSGGESGSSPRMRGALAAGDGATVGLGIIPADAGSTCRQALPSPVRPDHPRGCGEHLPR